jgi:hypothetical protein
MNKKRDYISPSDLTFLWNECKKCLWLKYNHKISTPGFMPLVGPMSAFQESMYREKATSYLSNELAPGVVSDWGKKVISKPIVIDGVETNWRIEGKYDLLLTFDDGSLGLIDCKVTTSEMDADKVSHYRPQLEAYAYALENSLNEESKKVSETGLMMWRVNGAEGEPEESFSFKTSHQYLSAGRDPAAFLGLVKEVINCVEGEMPESGDDCKNCKYVEKRKAVV